MRPWRAQDQLLSSDFRHLHHVNASTGVTGGRVPIYLKDWPQRSVVSRHSSVKLTGKLRQCILRIAMVSPEGYVRCYPSRGLRLEARANHLQLARFISALQR